MTSTISLGVIMAIIALGQSAPVSNDLHDVEHFDDPQSPEEISVNPELENLIILGISTGVHMGMVAIGGNEKTEAKIQNAFHLPQSGDSKIRAILKKYVLKMDKQKKSNIESRNKIFTKDEFEFTQLFNSSIESSTSTDDSEKSFGAVVQGIFSGEKWYAFVESAVSALWNWVTGSSNWVVKRRETRVLPGEIEQSTPPGYQINDMKKSKS